MGLTKWDPPQYGASRASFLREAVSRAYEARFTAQNSPQSARADSRSQSPAMNRGGTVSNIVAERPEDIGYSYPQQNDQSFSDMDSQLSSSSAEHIAVATPTTPVSPFSQLIDPVDKAMRLMVDELGFSEHDAKWALKITDTGEAIDADAAVRLLMEERRKRSKNPLLSRLARTASRSSNSSTDSLVDTLRSAGPTSNGGAGWRWG
jgi:hypothetical protein